MKIKENVSLKKYTTLRAGGIAHFFIKVKTVQKLLDAVKYAKKQKIPFFILGGGSNILFSDKGFKGLVIKNEIKGISFEKINKERVRVIGYAGENWDKFVEKTVQRELWGLENLSYIPGTLGAAPIQNIGAYGREVSDLIEYVEVLDVKNLSIRKIFNKDCGFSYRTSIFKNKKNNFVVISVSFLLSNIPQPFLVYKDLRDFFNSTKEKSIKLKEIRNAVIKIRKNKLPEVSKLGSAGSFFKNPIVGESTLRKIRIIYPNIGFNKENKDKYKLSAAFLIENSGIKRGYRVGDVGVYKKHALVLVNYGKATSKDIITLANFIEKEVYKKNKIKIFREVEII